MYPWNHKINVQTILHCISIVFIRTDFNVEIVKKKMKWWCDPIHLSDTVWYSQRLECRFMTWYKPSNTEILLYPKNHFPDMDPIHLKGTHAKHSLKKRSIWFEARTKIVSKYGFTSIHALSILGYVCFKGENKFCKCFLCEWFVLTINCFHILNRIFCPTFFVFRFFPSIFLVFFFFFGRCMHVLLLFSYCWYFEFLSMLNMHFVLSMLSIALMKR